jgi:hypothetical protein
MSVVKAPSLVRKHFSIDARAMLTWGRDSIKDHTTAVLELVKNSYDAAAGVAEITIHPGDSVDDAFIRIADNGVGMTDDDVASKWLRIGFSDKREYKEIRGRRRTGEKGIGRISADRLGSVLELRTQAATDEPVGLLVDWRWFEKPGKDLDAITLQPLESVDFEVPEVVHVDPDHKGPLPPPTTLPNSRSRSGTALTIRELRQTWTRADLDDLRRELSVLTSPIGGEGNFQIRLNSPLDSARNGVVSSPFYKTAEIEARFTWKVGPKVNCEFFDRNGKGDMRPAGKTEVPWANFVHQEFGARGDGNTSEVPPFGPVTVHLLFYLRAEETLRGTGLTVADLREFLDYHAGIKVYRDNIRVMPYGDPRKPEGDWLGLGSRKASEPAGHADAGGAGVAAATLAQHSAHPRHVVRGPSA